MRRWISVRAVGMTSPPAADVTGSEFVRYFTTKDAVSMSIVDDLLPATATALGDVKADMGPDTKVLERFSPRPRSVCSLVSLRWRQRLVTSVLLS
jgi:hypothetical protein